MLPFVPMVFLPMHYHARLLPLLLVILTVTNGLAQTDDLIIKAGYGVEKIHLGMPVAGVVALCRQPDTVLSYAQSLQEIQGYDEDFEKFYAHQLGFDTVYRYDWGSVNAPAPIFQIFAKNGRIVYLRFSELNYRKLYGRRWLRKFRLENDENIGITTKLKKITGFYSKPDDTFTVAILPNIYQYYMFKKQGIGLVFLKGRLKTIDIFNKTLVDGTVP